MHAMSLTVYQYVTIECTMEGTTTTGTTTTDQAITSPALLMLKVVINQTVIVYEFLDVKIFFTESLNLIKNCCYINFFMFNCIA